MNHRFLVAVLAASSALGGVAYAQSSDIRQAEQDRAAQRQRELNEQPQYLPGDRRRIEEKFRQGEADQRRAEQARARDEQARARDEQARARDERWRDGRGDSRYDPRSHDGRGDARYDPRYYQRWDSREQRWAPADRFGGDWRGRGAGPRHDWYRGGYVPREYRSRQYVVEDWRGHRLYAPPRGYQWVQAGGDYVLVAIATGLIATILLNQ